jgi:hypothetical protein
MFVTNKGLLGGGVSGFVVGGPAGAVGGGIGGGLALDGVYSAAEGRLMVYLKV